jgi:hypothetical protein
VVPCIPVCHVSAIFALGDLPKNREHYAKINADHYGNGAVPLRAGVDWSHAYGPSQNQVALTRDELNNRLRVRSDHQSSAALQCASDQQDIEA